MSDRIFTINVTVVFATMLIAVACGNPSDTTEETAANDKALTTAISDAPSSKETDGEATEEKAGEEKANTDADDCPFKGKDGSCSCPHKKEGNAGGDCPYKNKGDVGGDCPYKNKGGVGGDCPYKKEAGCAGDCTQNADSEGGCPHRAHGGCPHAQEAF